MTLQWVGWTRVWDRRSAFQPALKCSTIVTSPLGTWVLRQASWALAPYFLLKISPWDVLTPSPVQGSSFFFLSPQTSSRPSPTPKQKFTKIFEKIFFAPRGELPWGTVFIGDILAGQFFFAKSSKKTNINVSPKRNPRAYLSIPWLIAQKDRRIQMVCLFRGGLEHAMSGNIQLRFEQANFYSIWCTFRFAPNFTFSFVKFSSVVFFEIHDAIESSDITKRDHWRFIGEKALFCIGILENPRTRMVAGMWTR